MWRLLGAAWSPWEPWCREAWGPATRSRFKAARGCGLPRGRRVVGVDAVVDCLQECSPEAVVVALVALLIQGSPWWRTSADQVGSTVMGWGPCGGDR